MNKNGILLNLAAHASELIRELAHKHDDGVFLSEILKDRPYSHRRTRIILNGYCNLLAEVGIIFYKYDNSEDASKMVEEWMSKLKNHRSKEIKLLFDSISIDIGGDH
jgi:hypothetical protein